MSSEKWLGDGEKIPQWEKKTRVENPLSSVISKRFQEAIKASANSWDIISATQRRSRYFIDSKAFTGMSEGICIVNLAHITFANEAFGKILGVNAEELSGRKLLDFFDKKSATILSEEIINKQKTGEKSEFELLLVWADWEKRVIRIRATPKESIQGNITSTTISMEDITRQKLIERAKDAMVRISGAHLLSEVLIDADLFPATDFSIGIVDSVEDEL